jgi:PEP-CTERM motif
MQFLRNTISSSVLAATRSCVAGAALSLALPMAAQAAGPFAPAAGQAGSTAVSKSDPSIVQWATGYANYLPGSNVDATWKTPEKALGSAQGTSTDVVVLGDSGQITLTFSGSIFNGPGADFAVFENSFTDTFLELGWVEVSSNGTDFFRFANYSFTEAAVGGFGSVDPTNIEGLAGKYRQGFGTPFDLSSLAGTPGLDINDVRHVRIVDIVGNGTQFDSYPAEFGGAHPIYDPYPTTGSSGFDLDAVGVMHFNAATAVPEPGTLGLFGLGLAMLWAGAWRRTA